MKNAQSIIIIYLTILSIYCSCNGQNKQETKENTKEKTNVKKNDQTTITKSGIYYYTPNSKKIDSLKKVMGEDNFYIIADDSNAYFSEITQKTNSSLIKLKSKYVYFKNENFTLNIDNLKNNWGIIEYTKGKKPKIFAYVDYNLFLNDKTKGSNAAGNNDSIHIEKGSLFVNGKEYKGIIINEMSLSTSLKVVDNKYFILTYEYNASTVKQKHVYSFSCKNNIVYLTSKEIIKQSREGTVSDKIYLKNYVLKNQLYSELEDLGSSLNNSLLKNDSFAMTNLYNNLYEKIGILIYSIKNDSKFIDAPLEEDKYLKKVSILNTNKLNDVAYFLEQTGAYKESIYLLNEIIKKDPDRIVAYLNLADAQWGIEQFDNAKKSYQKYISLMKSQNKDLNKIPLRVKERIK